MEKLLTASRVRTFGEGQLVSGALTLLVWNLWASDWLAPKLDHSASIAGLPVEMALHYLAAILLAQALLGAVILLYPVMGRWTKGMAIRMHALAVLFLWGLYLGRATGIAPSDVELGATIFVSRGLTVTGAVFHLRDRARHTGGFFETEKRETAQTAGTGAAGTDVAGTNLQDPC